MQNGQKEKDGAPRLSYGVSSHVPSCEANHELMKKWCLRAGERQLVVPVEAEEPFRKALHSLGYGMPRV